MAREVENEPFLRVNMNPFHLLIVVGICIGSYYFSQSHWTFNQLDKTLPRYYPVGLGDHARDTIYQRFPAFRLLNQDSSFFKVPKQDSLSSFLIVNALGTFADSIRDEKVAQLQRLQTSIEPLDDVKILSFVVDSSIQSPSALKSLALAFGANSNKWEIVSADWPFLYLLLNNALHLKVNKDTYHIGLSERFVLIDRVGVTRGLYDGTKEADIDRLLDDIIFLRATKIK